jgi:hypothetical protein
MRCRRAKRIGVGGVERMLCGGRDRVGGSMWPSGVDWRVPSSTIDSRLMRARIAKTRDRSRSLTRPRQSKHALGNNVALNLRRAAFDCIRS